MVVVLVGEAVASVLAEGVAEVHQGGVGLVVAHLLVEEVGLSEAGQLRRRVLWYSVSAFKNS